MLTLQSSATRPSAVPMEAGRRTGDLATSKPRPNRPVAGSLLVLSASLTLATLGALVKLASTALPNEVIVFFRNFLAFLCLLPWLMLPQNRQPLKTRRFRFHLLRSVTGLGSIYSLFYALAHLQLAEAVLLSFSTPLFIPLIARVWLKEPVPMRIAAAILLGFLGVALILKPGLSVFRPVALVGLTSAFLAAVSMVTIRQMSKTEPATRIVFYFSCLGTLGSALPLIRAWEMPSDDLWLVLFALGLVAVIGQLLLTKGYSLAPAAQVGPFAYTNVIFSTFIGWWFWNEYLDTWSWVGALLICLTGIISTCQRGGVALPSNWRMSWKYRSTGAQTCSKPISGDSPAAGREASRSPVDGGPRDNGFCP